MEPTIVSEAGFRVIGIETRTSNAREMAGAGKIAQLWERLFKDNALARIPEKLDNSILALYTDYASDQDGEYTLVIGARVGASAQVPSGMVGKSVLPARYAVFTSERGPVEKVVPQLWQKIWSLPGSELGGGRAFVADFEVYDSRAANPGDAQVDVYLGIR
jgi:predicted transcriptional regulator YdeE